MKKGIIVILLLALTTVAALAGCRPAIQADRDTLFQVSTISALMQGVYDGSMTLGELRPYGDFGVGTFKDLDGEMLFLDGKFYRAQLDGSIVSVPDDTITPFAEVTFFDHDVTLTPDKAMSLSELQAYIDSQLPSLNLFYAIEVQGHFAYMKTRSVPAQKQPYPTLTEAVKNQQVTESRDIEGTIIGFRCPPYIDGVNVPGYHFHFIDKYLKKGGHVLDCQTSDIKVVIDNTANFIMELPSNKHFYQVNLGQSDEQGLNQVEKGK
ncbi:MAG: acetolactate decarboxylase [Dehalococcoidia bacterium]